MRIYKEEVPESLLYIESAACQMERMIKALLDLTYLGRKQLNPKQVDMASLATAVIELFSDRIERGNIQIHLNSLPTIYADRAAMEEIVRNLIDNALKYLLPARVGEITFSAEVGEAKTTFQLRDNGRGIAGEDMPKIFKIFRRVGQQNVDGEGIGLVRARALVHRLGGEM